MLGFLSTLLGAVPALMPLALFALKLLGKNEDELKAFQDGVKEIQGDRKAATRHAENIRDAEQQLDEQQHAGHGDGEL